MEDERQDPTTEPAEPRGEEPPRPPPPREGRRGRATRPLHPQRPCLNCGDPTPGEYCPTCGQRKVDVQVSVRTMVADVLEDQLFMDRRLPRTLSALLFRPGRLTVEHVNGRIASYIRPFRLYLVTSVIFFLLVSFLGLQLVREANIGGDEPGDAGEPAGEAAALSPDSMEMADLDSALAAIDAQIADTTVPGAVRQGLQLGRREIILERAAIQESIAERAGESEPVPPGDTTDADTTSAPPAPPSDTERPQTVNVMLGWENGDGPEFNFGIAALDSTLAARARRIGGMQPRQAAEELVSTFLNYTPTMMFVLLPVFALMLKLLYIRRGRFYAEHFVFLLHVHSFVYILATVMLLLRKVLPWWFELGLGGWILVYIFLAMHRVYGQGWMMTFLKYWTLGWGYFWIISLSLPLAVVATLLLF